MSDTVPSHESGLAELTREKDRLIRRYIELQDIVDDYNKQVYELCCEIELLNQKIKVTQEAEQSARMRADAATRPSAS